MEFIGWLGSLLLSFCGLPQALKAFKDKNSDGISWGFISMWLYGEIFAFIYAISINQLPIIFNCGLNTLIASVIFYYKYKTYRFRYNYLKLLVQYNQLRQMKTRELIDLLLTKIKTVFSVLYIFKNKKVA